MLPSNHTPLISLPALVLDLETTGLNVQNDRVIQIAAMYMTGEQLETSPVLDQLVNPGMTIPIESTRIHHIHDADVKEARPLEDIAEDITRLCKKHIIIGHHIVFDVAVLRHEFARHKLVWHEPQVLDVGLLAGALRPALPDVSLESVTDMLGISIHDRHSALGDCQAAAQCWQKLIPLLRDKGIRTLGEATSFANQRQDLVQRQYESGWLRQPNELQTTPLTTVPRMDSYAFEYCVKDVMRKPAVLVPVTTCLRDGVKSMVEREVGSLLIGKPDTMPEGIITERDLLKFSTNPGLDLDSTPVSKVMNSPVSCIGQNAMLYRALARMDRLEISHLCVIDDLDRPVGVVSQRDLLQYRARGPNMLTESIQLAEDTASLAKAYTHLASVAERLQAEDMKGLEIARVIASELQALTRRATELAMLQMQQEGKGQAPADWCVLVLGSGGRGESLLGADQDNALVHNGSEQDDAWFAEFGEHLANILDASGLPLCKGDVMIKTPLWRGNKEQWHQRIHGWLSNASSQNLLNVDIFYDLLPVAGDANLAMHLHELAISSAKNSNAFLNLLAQSVQGFAPRFKTFGRLFIEEGRIKLKRDGLLPLVSFARTLALRIGSLARSTPERLEDAINADCIAKGDARRLIELHDLLLTLVLQQQLRDIDSGVSLSSAIEFNILDKKIQKELQQELHHLATMVDQIHSFIAH